jgi:Homeodomain-like domain
MHPEAAVVSVLELHREGLNNCEIARRTGVSRPTVRDWVNGRLPHSFRSRESCGRPPGPGGCRLCGGADHNLAGLGPDYVHLLGLYLGDGAISEHRRQVFRMRIKHERPIFLAWWQQELARRWPKQLIRGLIQSDGCRVVNTGRGGWRHPRYAFSNVSTDIPSIFCSACDCLGLRWTASFPTNEKAAVSIYVSRKADVARLDEFVGPKCRARCWGRRPGLRSLRSP